MRADLGQAGRAMRATRLSLHARLHGVGQWPTRMRGMTLVELLTVMTVLAVLSSLAVSSYRRYLIRANRTDATTMLLRIQVGQEKFFLQNNTYTTDVTNALGFGSEDTPAGTYKVTVAAPTGGAIGTGYVATATATGKQAKDDPQCATITINDRGTRTSSPGATSVCWH